MIDAMNLLVLDRCPFNGSGMAPWERFDAWKACHQLALAVYRTTRRFPADERYGLTAQLRRAAFSAPANIVERSALHGRRQFARHLDIAVGSLAEIEYALQLARDLGYLPANEADQLAALQADAGRLTWRLYLSVSRRRAGA